MPLAVVVTPVTRNPNLWFWLIDVKLAVVVAPPATVAALGEERSVAVTLDIPSPVNPNCTTLAAAPDNSIWYWIL